MEGFLTRQVSISRSHYSEIGFVLELNFRRAIRGHRILRQNAARQRLNNTKGVASLRAQSKDEYLALMALSEKSAYCKEKNCLYVYAREREQLGKCSEAGSVDMQLLRFMLAIPNKSKLLSSSGPGS